MGFKQTRGGEYKNKLVTTMGTQAVQYSFP